MFILLLYYVMKIHVTNYFIEYFGRINYILDR